MSPIVVVFVRVLGAYTILSNLGLLTTFLAMPMITRDLRDIIWAPLVPPAFMIAAGVAILLFSKSLVALAFRGISDPPSPILDSEPLLSVGTSLIGIFLATTSFAPFVVAVLQYVVLGDVGRSGDLNLLIRQQDIIASLARSLGSILVGLLLVYMSGRVPTLGRSASAQP